MAATYDLTGVRRGNSYERTFRFKDGSNAPVDLTGSVLVFRATTATGTITKTTADNSFVMDDPTSGEVTLSLTPTETRQFAVGRLRNRYEIERRIGGNEETLLAGSLVVMQGVNDDAD